MFTVVIPVYNNERHVLRCVESALRQTFGDFRLIVVDDGSTDGSASVVERIQDTRLALIRQTNGGVGSARNAGIARARSEWVAFLDADDLWYPNHLRELHEVIRTYPAAGLVASDHFECDASAGIPPADDSPGVVSEIDYFRRAARRIGVVCTTTTAVRTSALEAVGGFKSFRAGEDLELWARVALHYAVAVSSARTAVYVRGTGGTMETLAARPHVPKHIGALSDVSPSVALLASALESGAFDAKRRSMVAYINSRIRQSIKAALHGGDVATARRAAELFVQPLSLADSSLRTALALPETFIGTGLKLARAARGRL